LLLNSKQFLSENRILNYINGLEIKMTKNNKGRGVFASRDLKRGELLAVEKAIVEVNKEKNLYASNISNKEYAHDKSNQSLVKKC